MSETILKALIQLFAIIATVDKDKVSTKAKDIVESYLKQKLNQRLVNAYLTLFDQYVIKFHNNIVERESETSKKRNSLNSVKVLKICKQVNKNLQQKEKFIVLVRLIEFVFEDDIVSEEEKGFVEIVANTFNINEQVFANTLTFITNDKHTNIDKDKILVINSEETAEHEEHLELGEWFKRNKPGSINEVRHILRERIDGEMYVFYIETINTFILKYVGKNYLWLNSQHIFSGRIYVLNHGAIIKGRKNSPVYYSDIASVFLHEQSKTKIDFAAENIEFSFPKSTNGIKNFSLNEESGKLMGVMGGSGAGKSTLFDLLNGKLTPSSGTIKINGYDINKNNEKLKGVIGFVSQDDLLIEELNVFQNLYYNAKLCFSNFSEKQILKVVIKTLNDLDLGEIKGLQVGNPLNKIISGGQRKRLNIALELMREPSVLFVDEPTSGLSSLDSEMVMLLLKQQTLKGRLVFVNIHQPSSNIFKLLDKLLIIDKGGHVVYQGNPIDAITYFKSASAHADANDHECGLCGNVNPEQVLEVVEEKMVNEFGKLTKTRKMSPEEWYERYKGKIESKQPKNTGNKNSPLPRNLFSVPGFFTQFRIFLFRSLLARFANKQYVIVNFMVAPLLAVLLGFFTRNTTDGEYIFSNNENIFPYLFMAVVVALFIGMTVSAEEIIRDRKILERESFLNLSWFSYINSKVVLMFAMSAIQMLMFVLIGNYILEIKGLDVNHWLILFATSCMANLIGLNISATLNSVVTIYILIPFILVPQLLLGGVLVSYDKLHQSLARTDYVPFVGDLMTSRWAFEALAVTQFKDNVYTSKFFDYDQQASNLGYNINYLIPAISKKIDKTILMLPLKKTDEINNQLNFIRSGVAQLKNDSIGLFNNFRQLTSVKFNKTIGEQLKFYLKKQRSYHLELKKEIKHIRDSVFKKLQTDMGKDEVYEFKKKYTNKRLAEFVTNKSQIDKIIESEGNLVRKKDPVYMIPNSETGRAQFYSPVKIIAGHHIDTFWFNIVVIWLFTLLLYILLLMNFFRKAINYFDRYKTR